MQKTGLLENAHAHCLMRAGTCNNGWPGCFLVWWGALSKNVAQSGPLGRENLPTFWQVGVVRYLGVIFTPSEPPTTGTISSIRGRPCRSLGRGLSVEASPHPPVAMALFPADCDHWSAEI